MEHIGNTKWKVFDKLHLFFPVVVAIGELIAFLFLIDKFTGYLNDSSSGIIVLFVVLSVLLLIAIVFIFVYYGKFQKYKRDVRRVSDDNDHLKKYADVYSSLNSAFDYVHRALRADMEKTDDCIVFLQLFCIQLEDAFNKTTGKKCHVCIKMLAPTKPAGHPEAETGVFTLCRSEDPEIDRSQVDFADEIHPLKDNTDFNIIFRNFDKAGNKVFFSNALPKIHEYSNSSFLRYGHSSVQPFMRHQDWEEKNKNWGLPYKSCIVAPIYPKGDKMSKELQKKAVVGFLCVDAKDMDVFDESIHPVMLAGSANGLYNIIKKIRSLSN